MDNVTAVKEKIDIVELVGQYVELKKSGKNYKGLCPFHSEKTPSFMVSPEIQSYRCFGCGKSGDVFNFVMDTEGMEFYEALKMLADKAGVEIKHDENAAKNKDSKSRLFEANEIAANFYHHILTKHKFGKEALEYLKERGLKPKIITEFKLGYAPKSWDSLSKFLVTKNFKLEEIEQAGLGKLRKDNKSTYDMFRGRLMIPLLDHMGKVAGFSGRALEKAQEPKYINTPETPIFHKEQFLFGLDKAKTEIRKKNEAVIVEGQIDMIAPYQAGIKNVVASQGTALTLPQIKLIKRYADAAVLIFDNDLAGMEAAVRGVEVLQNADINLKVAVIEGDYKDPDEMARKDITAFKKLIKEALPLWDFYFVYAGKKYDFSDVFQKKRAGEFLLSLIKKISDEVVKAEYIKKFATVFEMDEQAVIEQMKKVPEHGSNIPQNKAKTVIEQSETIENEGYPKSEIYLLALVLNSEKGSFRDYLDVLQPEIFTSKKTKHLVELLKKEVEKSKKFEIKAFYDKISQDYPELYRLLETAYLYNSDTLDSEIAGALERVKKDFYKKEIKRISKDIAKAEAASDQKKVDELQNKVNQLIYGRTS